jgi:hypothetical protein
MKNSIKLLLITTMLIPTGFIGAQTVPIQHENNAKTWQFPVQHCKERVGNLVNGVRTGVQVGNNHARAFARNLKKKSSTVFLGVKNHKKSVAAGTVVVAALLIALDNMVNRKKDDRTYGRRLSLWFFNNRAFGEPVENNQAGYHGAPKSSMFMKDMPDGYFGKPEEGLVVDYSDAATTEVDSQEAMPQNPLMKELESKLAKRRALPRGKPYKGKEL